jgi:phosphoribosylformylglycinamidine cyclo-ligase
VFGWLARAGGVDLAEMLRAFNCGVGLCAVVPAGAEDAALALLAAMGETAAVIGRVTDAPGFATTGTLRL